MCRLLEQDLAEYGGAFSITERWQEAEPLPGEGWLIYGAFRAEPGDPSAGRAELDLRFSAVCTETEDGLQLCHLHLSQPDFDQRPGRLYVLQDSRARTEEFRQRAAESQRELLDVMENLPGGVLRCRDDRDFTILQMSSGFLDMVGYRRTELEEQYHNRLIDLIHPDDRENVRKNFRAPVINSTVEQEYRLICRDGHPLWVLDRSRLMRSPGGAPVFNTMLMDITERKQAQEALRLSLERHQIIMDQTNNIDVDGGYINQRSLSVAKTIKKYNDDPSHRPVKYCSAIGGIQWSQDAATIENEAMLLWNRYCAQDYGGEKYHYMIDGKPVKFRASAAVPRMYMALTGSDIFSDIGDLMEQFHPSKQQKADRQQKAQVNLKDLSKMSVFENIAYVMAKAADNSVPDTAEEWLDQFGMMSIWYAFPQIAALWAASQKTNVDLKKKNVRQNAR